MQIIIDTSGLEAYEHRYRKSKMEERFNKDIPVTVLGTLQLTGRNPPERVNQFDYYLCYCHQGNSLANFDWALDRQEQGSHFWIPVSDEYADLRLIEHYELERPCMWVRTIDARPAANKYAKASLARYDD